MPIAKEKGSPCAISSRESMYFDWTINWFFFKVYYNNIWQHLISYSDSRAYKEGEKCVYKSLAHQNRLTILRTMEESAHDSVLLFLADRDQANRMVNINIIDSQIVNKPPVQSVCLVSAFGGQYIILGSELYCAQVTVLYSRWLCI